MSVHILALMSIGNIGQKMGGVKREFFIDLHFAANVNQDGKMAR